RALREPRPALVSGDPKCCAALSGEFPTRGGDASCASRATSCTNLARSCKNDRGRRMSRARLLADLGGERAAGEVIVAVLRVDRALDLFIRDCGEAAALDKVG